ncbi:MAG: hypothetical protein COW18_11315 [Zetaproteobacteria bacterium CG12_big_fil_rev_8_21_14_0_65_54_13]|nr:MAG: hypothetical protein COX55_08735 [Zetaproteobacteria bacterium CG23_combo_of_CG06-09_8_20_14_all_54_7]PIW45723.1 MAG: hypothetical protein COW18_11315 [Zetaproteobacteria bacterium CG12_big_fil_rev_8_21_14_0_65_54_13]PJA28812.1 MAG: hypothetical protein CO188_08160 [Zetaproteobacteria bacterium CG_4_9_14_3_um_filter_54_145]
MHQGMIGNLLQHGVHHRSSKLFSARITWQKRMRNDNLSPAELPGYVFRSVCRAAVIHLWIKT